MNFYEKKNLIYGQTGHILLKLEHSYVEYECGNCGSIRTSRYSNLVKPGTTKFCSNCINPGRKTLEEVCQNFEKLKLENSLFNYSILEYLSNKNVTFKCDKDHIFKMAYADIKRGRRCPQCAPNRRAKTNLEKYNAVNPFASPQIKEKIKLTCLEKYGVTHHMKLKEIRDKAAETNLKKIGVKYAFNTKETFDKIRQKCLERYGVEFPLQNKFIQAKISQTFLNKIDAERPMSNQVYWKNKLLDKYGVDHYSKTDQFKVDYIKTCLDKYGVDNPMKCPNIFKKSMSSSFSRKPFIFPSGRVDYVMGYEPTVLNKLLEKYDEDDIITDVCYIPTFKYKRVSSDARPLKDEFVISVYYPDILLPDKIIEVKSEYHYNKDKRNVCRKMKAVAKSGYFGELWVYKNPKILSFKKTYKKVGEKVIIEKWVVE
ncbi:zinc-ribbon-containing protein [Invertebrate iridescent virus 22]|uniref:Zinc-ribbon-containing protein n=1 Tax=Invertebrate iridescent virus 22 TaxID=345198 RepID=S6DDQ7_9VIRU|nr:zinc-ribbon-containing protein [Invertebrate iridescent virus 22]CCV01749.1 zinc-ribbon-containing protein [Invertebrate iridescent virus 22]